MKKRTLGCICDHGTTECKDIVSLCDAHRGYCGVYVCNKGLQEILRLTALNDAMGCHCERSEAIQFLGRGMRILTGLPRKSDDFLAMTDNRNMIKKMHNEFSGLPRHCVARNDGATTRFFGLRPLNDGKPMRNEQNGLVVMFSSAKYHEAQETKPETDRNQIQNKLWQKQSNRNISTCVAQREVA